MLCDEASGREERRGLERDRSVEWRNAIRQRGVATWSSRAKFEFPRVFVTGSLDSFPAEWAPITKKPFVAGKGHREGALPLSTIGLDPLEGYRTKEPNELARVRREGETF